MSARSIASRLALGTASVVTVLAIAELGTHAAVALARLPVTSGPEFRLSRPAPYATADYWSRDFVMESFRQPGGNRTDASSGLRFPLDFDGRWIRVLDGRRRTTGQPERPTHWVHVFGGSTVYGAEVPDEHTLPSRLQYWLGRLGHPELAVVNHGYSGLNQREQRARLRHAKLTAGDVAVFYDGVNDVWQTLYYGNPGLTMRENDMVTADRFGIAHGLVHALHRRFARHSSFVARFLRPRRLVAPPHLDDPARVETLGVRLEADFGRGLEDAHRVATRRGARFFHFLQPTIFSGGALSDYETAVLSIPALTRPGFAEAFATGYPRLRSAMRRARSAGLDTTDLSRVLADRPAGEEYFLDPVHVNHAANDRLARHLAEVVAGGLLSLDPGRAIAQ